MNQEIFNELMQFLAQPGGVSKSAWEDTYTVMSNINNSDIFLQYTLSVLSRVARARKVQLPDPLHNLMVLNVSDKNSTDWRDHWRNESNKKYVNSYLKMINKLNKSKLNCVAR